jgi:cbb3-type cytochrome oxidase subunit 3
VSLSDIMSYESLTLLPQVALVIFLIVFAAIAFRTFGRGRSAELDAAARLPLADDSAPSTRE